jgi:hypothetical protein
MLCLLLLLRVPFRAVMSYEACSCITADCSVCTGHTNGGCKITKMHYKNILKWR